MLETNINNIITYYIIALFSGPITCPGSFDEYSEALTTDHFCYVINEVTTDSNCSSSERCSTCLSQESEMESSDGEQPVIRRRYHGNRLPGIPSCIEEQKEETLSSSCSDNEMKILNQSEHCKSMLKIQNGKKRFDSTDKFRNNTRSPVREFENERVFEYALIDSEEVRGADALPSSIPDRLHVRSPQYQCKNFDRFEEKCDDATDIILEKSAKASKEMDLCNVSYQEHFYTI